MRLGYCIAGILLGGLFQNMSVAVADDGFEKLVRPFFHTYCTHCHGEERQRADLTLHELRDEFDDSVKLERWRMLEERIRYHEMPPQNAPVQPQESERKQVSAWIREKLLETQRSGVIVDKRYLLPEFGNYVDHNTLFNSIAGPVTPAGKRLWRLRPPIYQAMMERVTEGMEMLHNPFPMRNRSGIKDYASLYFVDEPATDLLLSNAEKVVRNQAQHPRFSAIHALFNSLREADPKLMREAIQEEFELLLLRPPTSKEMESYLALWEKSLKTSGHPVASRATLMAILMQPLALFRSEFGEGPLDEHGRQRLSQREIAGAVNFAVSDVIDPLIWNAAQRGELGTQEQLAIQVERILSRSLDDNTRLMDFFREYFGYRRALDIFKDPLPQGTHHAHMLVDDLEQLIRHVLEEDTNVLHTLLTTNQAFVNWQIDRNTGQVSAAIPSVGVEAVYGLPVDWKWTAKQPIELPSKQRMGILTHPAWLVAWSGNFDNDPIRRGKWIRTRLLGGSVPDVPIGVDARISNNKNKTLRSRLDVKTAKRACWRCHKKMDDLGLPFEQYTHYGYFRLLELQQPVDTSGLIDFSNDANLDGISVQDPFDLIRRLAASERVEQVFVRHVFRYFLGRNETLDDAATLQIAWRAYRDNGGSFKSLLASLLVSDSFLYRMP